MSQLKAMSPIMVACAAIYPSPINRCSGQRGNVDDLIKSISAQGLLQPPIVRKHPTIDNGFELVIGERRWKACSLLADEMPVFVHELTDIEAHEKTITENMQREDLSPLEEAESIQVLIQDGLTIEQVADRLGKDVKWIARRSKLSNLIPEIIAVYNDPDSDSCIRSWTSTHLELLARFDSHIQRKYFDDISNYDNVKPLRELKEDLNQFLMHLSSAPWKLTDKELCPTAGACSDCTKRTSLQTNLFEQEEVKGKIIDKCVDADCWKEKSRLFVFKKESELREKNPDLIIINKNMHNGIFEQEDHFVKDAVREFDVIDCKKSDPGAKQALVVDGSSIGQTKWVKPTQSNSQRSTGPKSLEERYDGLSRKRLFQVLQAIISTLSSEIQEPKLIIRLDDESAMAIAIIWGCRRLEGFEIPATADFSLMDSWKNFDIYTKQNKSKDYYIDLIRCSLPGWREILEKYADSKTYSGMSSRSQKIRANEGRTMAERICKFLKFDFDELVRKAELEIKPPKSWEKLADDTTIANVGPENDPKPAETTGKKTGKKRAKKASTVAPKISGENEE